jgi:CRISPR-associated Csh1 family protein
MIKSFYTAGKLLSQLPEYADYFRPWANPFPKIRGEAKVIVAEINDGQLEPDLKVEDFKTAMVDKYLFREAKANATNLVPTFYMQAQADPEKQTESIRKMVKKVRQSVTNYKHTFVSAEQIDEIERMIQTFQFSPQTSYLFTMRVDGHYFGDVAEYRDLFVSDAYQKYSNGSSATNKVCAVTYETSPEVWGRVDTLGFAVTDVAFARNGFNTADSYKMFPVSPEVVKTLEGAKRLILERLSRTFFGMRYFVMPRFLQKVSDENAEEVWKEFLQKCSIDQTSMTLQFGPLFQNENLIGEILDDELLNRNSVYYDIFFYQPNNAQFMIKLHVSDILPSRFGRIMTVKEKIDRHYRPVVDQIPTFVKGQFEPFTVTFAAIKDYFAKKVRTDWVFHPYFFRIVEAVFYNQPLDREQLLRAFIDAIRVSFKNSGEQPYQFSRDVRHTFVILQFFYQLKLLSFSCMEPTESQPVGLTLETFEQQHPDLLANPLRRAAFYLGCEVEMLLAKQQNFYKSQPFRQHLNGLNLDTDQLRKIHLKLTAKIGEYADTGSNDKRHFYPSELNQIAELDVHIGPSLLLADNTLSKADISYAFAVGMAMQKAFTNEQIRVNRLNKDNQNNIQNPTE